MVDVGGRLLYFECQGAGSPTVILEVGFRTRSDVWTNDLIQPDAPRRMGSPGLAELARVCASVRPGTATVPGRTEALPLHPIPLVVLSGGQAMAMPDVLPRGLSGEMLAAA